LQVRAALGGMLTQLLGGAAGVRLGVVEAVARLVNDNAALATAGLSVERLGAQVRCSPVQRSLGSRQ
jgi:hypothetical protein